MVVLGPGVMKITKRQFSKNSVPFKDSGNNKLLIICFSNKNNAVLDYKT